MFGSRKARSASILARMHRWKTSALIITRSLAFESSFSIEAILLISSFFTGFAVAALGSLLILAINLRNLHLHFFLLNLNHLFHVLGILRQPRNNPIWGPFLESPETFFGPEKPFLLLRISYSVKLISSYAVKGREIKITVKFRASRRFRFEDTKRNMSPEKFFFQVLLNFLPAMTCLSNCTNNITVKSSLLDLRNLVISM